MNTSEQLMHTYLEEVARKGRVELIEQIAHEDMVDEANVAFGGPPGRAGLVAHVKGFRKHVTDADLSVHKIVGSDREVMAWWSFTGMHTGPWLGQSPTNKPISGTVFSFFTLEDGLIARYRLWLRADFEPPIVFDTSDPATFPNLL